MSNSEQKQVKDLTLVKKKENTESSKEQLKKSIRKGGKEKNLQPL